MKKPQLTAEQFQAVYPQVAKWIDQTLASHGPEAQTVASMGFKRLPLYFNQSFLTSAKFIIIDRMPVPPLASMGLPQYAEFEKGDYDGVTYLDTFFVRRHRATDEGLYFHELIHIIQWRLLGPERFLAAYAAGLSAFGYRDSPLEVMAYNAEAVFNSQSRVFDAEGYVREELPKIT
jgi:hypothetical protein